MTLEQKIVRTKLGLLELARQLGSVSQACQLLGYSRDSFYRFKRLYERGGELALVEMSRRRPHPRNRVSREVEAAVLELALEQPTWGPTRVAGALRVRGFAISPAGVRGVWMRNDLQTVRERLRCLEARAVQDGVLLTEGQVRALGRTGVDKKSRGELESECPGYCAAQDSWYLGRLSGLGNIHQQTCIDTYTKVAFARLYDRSTPLTAAELLRDRVLPFFEAYGLRLGRVLTDLGGEYCGVPFRHEYELYLAAKRIEHVRAKSRGPQGTGICDRFHRTILEEFYRAAFRTKAYRTLEELQADLDRWMARYNTERAHPERWCFGKTPMRTFLDALGLASAKLASG